MRVFAVCADPGVPPDGTKGASIHFRSLTAALVEEGCDVTAFRVASAGAAARASEHWRELHGADTLVAAASEFGTPGFVYERYALGHSAGLEAARRMGCPFVLEVNAPLVDETARYRPQHGVAGSAEVEQRLWSEADLVVAVSEPLRRRIAEVRGHDAGTAVVHNGVEPSLFGEPADVGPTAEPALVFLGHPKPWHGVDGLLPLLDSLLASDPQVRLRVIGGGPGAEELRDQAIARNLDRMIEITGEMSHELATRELRRGTIMIAPYPEVTPFYFSPIKIVEGMAAGLPVVTSGQGDVPEIVADAGIVVPPGDRAKLADAVAALLADPGRREDLGRRARERAFTRFTWAHSARSVVRLVNTVVGVAP